MQPDPLPTDLGNAERFAHLHADRFRHVKERRSWLVWEEGRWRQDMTGAASRAAKDTVRDLLRAAVEIEDDHKRAAAVKHALASQSRQRIEAMLSLAETEPEFALAADELDRDPYMLSCPNGTLDLRTGRLRAHDPADLISLGTDVPFDPAAICPRWEMFLLEIFDGDEERVAFLRRLVGYCLTGDTREHALFVLHGAGCNGKTTLVEIIKRLLGQLASTAPFESFVRTRNDRGVRNDLARLHRARLVVAAESGEGRRLDEATVKGLTGGDTVAARFLYGEFFEFRPRFKLFLVTNHRPKVDGDDDAIWRRLRLLPFDVSFEGREDKHLDEALQAELPGILAWAVQGCLEWQQDGLSLPPAVASATSEYRQDEDVLGAFLAERCSMSESVVASDLRDAYESYCKEIGEPSLKANVLGRRLTRRGIHVSVGNSVRTYHGVSLKEAA